MKCSTRTRWIQPTTLQPSNTPVRHTRHQILVLTQAVKSLQLRSKPSLVNGKLDSLLSRGFSSQLRGSPCCPPQGSPASPRAACKLAHTAAAGDPQRPRPTATGEQNQKKPRPQPNHNVHSIVWRPKSGSRSSVLMCVCIYVYTVCIYVYMYILGLSVD